MQQNGTKQFPWQVASKLNFFISIPDFSVEEMLRKRQIVGLSYKTLL